MYVGAKLAAAVEEVDDGRKKRSGSNPKRISLELVYKSSGLEHKLILSPATSHSKNHQASEWLRALKKVRIMSTGIECMLRTVHVSNPQSQHTCTSQVALVSLP